MLRIWRASKDDAVPRRRLLSTSRLSSTPLREGAHALPIAADQRFFFCAAPPFDLPLAGDCVHCIREVLTPDQLDRAARECVSAIRPAIVLADLLIERLARAADIVRAVRAAQNANVDGVVVKRRHMAAAYSRPSFEAHPSFAKGSGRAAPQDEAIG